MHQRHGLRRLAGLFEDFLLVLKGVDQDAAGYRKVAEDKFVALLGDRGGLAGIECADQTLGAFVDHLFGLGTGDLHVRFRVAAHDLKVRHADVLEDAAGDVDTALAILADAGKNARTRQQHADFQRGALTADDVERRGAGKNAGGTETSGEGAAGHAR